MILWAVWRHWADIQLAAPGHYQTPGDVVVSIVADIHGDNALVAYPKELSFLTCAEPATRKFCRELGFLVKEDPSETFVTNQLHEVRLMSWYMWNLGNSSAILACGWKSTAECVKMLALPERLIDFDAPTGGDFRYLVEITAAAYLLGYWNIEARGLIAAWWTFLQTLATDEQLEEEVRFEHLKDFFYKTGTAQSELVSVIHLSHAEPYPHDSLVKVWLGPVHDVGRVAPLYASAPLAPTPAQAARTVSHYLAGTHRVEMTPKSPLPRPSMFGACPEPEDD